jgi:hypothetical protein
MKLLVSAVFFAMFLASADFAIGIAYPNIVKPPIPAIIYSPQQSDILVFRGIISQFGEGTALFTDRAVYPLLGGDFAMIVGKEVNIIGQMVKEDDVEKIEVARVQFDRE